MLSLTVHRVDLKNRSIRLDGQQTKSGEPRYLPLSDDTLYEIIRTHLPPLQEATQQTQYVFTHGGSNIRDFRWAWNNACRESGLGYGYKSSAKYVEKYKDQFNPGPTFHDFRRSAARNLIRSGINQQVAMRITGHKTPSIFQRYNIVENRDVAQAMQQQAEYLNSKIGSLPDGTGKVETDVTARENSRNG